MPPPLLIVNPRSGGRSAAGDLARVLEGVERLLGDVAIRYTTRRGHARHLALQGAAEGHSLIVAVGGDGTFSEVADGVLAFTEGPSPATGIINLGTGGDFRRSLGIGEGLDNCLTALSAGRERLVDVGRASFLSSQGKMETHHFVNVLSAGLGGLVDRYIERMPSVIGGKVGYYLAALLAVARSKEQPLRARITWQGVEREEAIPAYLVAICNGRWFGGGMDVAPMARLDDGRLEVVTVTARSKPYLADRVRGVYTGRHLLEPTVHHFPCHAIELRLEDPLAERRFFLDVDGEALGSLPLAVEIVPRKLRVRA
ncbi:MAG: diacylglycerol kinase family lipid kinase [Actinobacteria bacterium]|nr:diacylglycerol kinase family lipid kinase [Actinomycetota bacterium]